MQGSNLLKQALAADFYQLADGVLGDFRILAGTGFANVWRCFPT